MTPVVAWGDDGVPRSPRFGDVFRRQTQHANGPCAQARGTFLAGCGLVSASQVDPALAAADGFTPAWHGRPEWRVLETGFGLGLNALALWHAWRQDPQRPQRLHLVSLDAWPVQATDIVQSAQTCPDLMSLAHRLADEWVGVGPGHRRWSFPLEGFADNSFELTLVVAPIQDGLASLDTPFDAVFLDGFSPDLNPDMWSAETMNAVAKRCRPGTRVATWCVQTAFRHTLTDLGFEVSKHPGVPPKRQRLEATFAPRWPVGRGWRASAMPTPEKRAVIVGGGISGASVAHSLVRRGWQVTVMDAADAPAAGASGLPVGLVYPHISPDDAMLSRVTRAGLSLTLPRLRELLKAGVDWAAHGALEHRIDSKLGLPTEPTHPVRDWSMQAGPEHRLSAGLPSTDWPTVWHPRAAWLRPARLIAAYLSHPRITWLGGVQVHRLRAMPPTAPSLLAADAAAGNDSNATTSGWQLLDDQGQVLAEAPYVVLAGGFDSRALLPEDAPAVPWHALRGQIALGPLETLPEASRALLPPFPVNGHGSFLSGMAGPDGRPHWFLGSSFERGLTHTAVDPAGHALNHAKLPMLLPHVAAALPAPDQWQGWAGVRCTLPDRFPAVGLLSPQRLPGLMVCAGMGARGLTLSALAGEVLAAELHGEPWPIEPKLAHKLLARRFDQRN